MPPRPRPRPRPVAKTSSFGSTTPVSPVKPVSPEIQAIDGATPPSPIKSLTTNRYVDTEDDFFDRSDRRRLEALSKRAAKTPEPLDSDNEEDSTPSSGKKRKRGPGATKTDLNLPKWTHSSRIVSDSIEKTPVLTLSSDSDGSEDDIVVVGEPTPRARRILVRPKSITPPPQVDRAALERVRQITRDAIAAPVTSDDEDDVEVTVVEPALDLDLDPELAAIKARAKAKQRSATATRNVSHSQDDDTPQGTQRQPKGPETVSLSVRIYPEDWRAEMGNTNVRQLRFKVKRHDPFRRAFQHIAERAGVSLADLVVTYEHNKVWASSTPDSLKIWDEADLEAYSSMVHELVQTARHLHGASLEPAAAEDSQASEAEEAVEQKLNVNLLSQDRERPMRVAVKTTTTISKLISGFMRKSGIEGRRAVIAFEGNDLDPASTVGDHDLEDGDQLEVKFL